ncbi:recombinase family protein [Bacillus sp. MMSF_3328]|uniref:recombinase family protein n=1 Tax=Bacillus sp. MMSF_3328 TaxID=3047080 RepID=UPI00273F70D5|nr:recombinase family protein [Bacillus sp. MMSF_3328]
MLIGYMRPLQGDENCENQKKTLQEIGCETILAEEHASPKRRTQLTSLLEGLKPGDKIVVTRLFSLADSSRHLVELLEEVDSKNAFIFSLAENIDTGNSGYSFLYITKHLVEFQSDVKSEKTKQGLLAAKEKGNIAGRPRKPDKNIRRAIEMYQSKQYSLKDIKEETGISKSTLYRYLEG